MKRARRLPPGDGLIGVYPTLAPSQLVRSGRAAAPTASFPFDQPQLALTHLGRGAVWLALRALGLRAGQRVAMPAYHCGAEVEAARVAGLDVAFYRVDGSLQADQDDLAAVAASTDATYLISYFGFPPPPPPSPPAARTLIVDAAHGLFSGGPSGPLGAGADAAVFCPRKSLGVPDGGALLAPGAAAVPGRPPWRGVARSVGSLVAGRAALSRARPLRGAATATMARASRADAAAGQGRLTEAVIGEWGLAEDDLRRAATAPSRLTARLAPRADGEHIRARRRDNYEALAAELGAWCPNGYRRLPPGVCPLLFPVMASDRAGAIRRLLGSGVRAIEVWPVPHPLLDRDRFSELEPIRRGLLGLPVHQDLETRHVQRVVTAAQLALRGR